MFGWFKRRPEPVDEADLQAVSQPVLVDHGFDAEVEIDFDKLPRHHVEPLYETPPPGTSVPSSGYVGPEHPAYERQQAMLRAARQQAETTRLEGPVQLEQHLGHRPAPTNLAVFAHAFSPAEFDEYIKGTPLFPSELLRPPQGRTLRGVEVVLYRHYLLSIPDEDRQVLYAQGQAEGTVVKNAKQQFVELGGMEAVRVMAYALMRSALDRQEVASG